MISYHVGATRARSSPCSADAINDPDDDEAGDGDDMGNVVDDDDELFQPMRCEEEVVLVVARV